MKAFKPKAISVYLSLYFSAIAVNAMANNVKIDEISVSGKVEQQIKEKAFTKAGAVSYAGSDKNTQGLDSVVRALPGTFTHIDPAQGTVNINIRGGSGLGRVNTTIDGVPQTFFGTSANGDSRYHTDEGGLGPSNQFGTIIDPSFLTNVSIERGANTGATGVNALLGSAHLKTIGVDDVLLDGNKVGVLSKLSYGSNKLGYRVMGAVAGKTQAFTETGSVGAMFAYSRNKMGSNYKRGDGQYATSNGFVKRMDQRPESWLAKVEVRPSDSHNLLFTNRHYESNIGGRTLDSEHFGLDYKYTPESDLVDLAFLASRTTNKQKFNDDALVWTLSNVSAKNRSDYLNLQNTSRFQFKPFDLELLYGGSYFSNSYDRRATGDEGALEHSVYQPSGKQTIKSLYITPTFKKDIYSLETGLSYEVMNIKGYKPACDVYEGVQAPCFPVGAANMDKTYRALNHKIQLSAEFSPWFMPYVSYGRSSRMANVQEAFFNQESGSSMNPFLKPEKAKTYEIGFNTFKHNALFENDTFGLKVNYFRSKIRDFIYTDSFYLDNSGRLTGNIDESGPIFHAQIAVNSPTTVTKRGFEVELNYRSDYFFSNLSYTRIRHNDPFSVTAITTGGFGFGGVDELPKSILIADVGTYLFDKKVTAGLTFKHYGKFRRINPEGINTDTSKGSLQEMPKNPLVTDAYVHYQPTKNVLLKFGVQNLFNKLYIEPLNAQNATPSQLYGGGADGEDYSFTNYARGRTYVVGGEFKF